METSKEIGSLASALSKTQGMMKAAQLDGLNPFYNSKYSTLASIIESSRQALAANSLAVIQGVSTEYDPLVVKINTMLVHSSNQWIRETLTVRPAKVGIHELASAITYARRIAMASLLAIYADDDDGNLAAEIPTFKGTLDTVKKETNEKSAKIPKANDRSQQVKPEKKMQKEESSKQTNISKVKERAKKIREIFSLSGQLSQTPIQMKEEIGKIIGLDRSISDSSQIKDEELDVIIVTFRKALESLSTNPQREAA
jgi:acyl-CoA hydrolase